MSINSDNIFIRSDYDNFQLGGKKNKKSRKKSKRGSRKRPSKKKSNAYSISIFDEKEKDNDFSIFNPGYDKRRSSRHRDDHIDNYRRYRPGYNGLIMSPSVMVHSPVKSIEQMTEDVVKRLRKDMKPSAAAGTQTKGEGRVPQIHPMAREMMGNKLSQAFGQQMQQMPYEAMTTMPQMAPQLPYETMTQQVVPQMAPQMAPQMYPTQMMGEGQLNQEGGNIQVESDFETYSDELRISSDFAEMVGGAKRKGSRKKGSKKRSSRKRPSRKRPSRKRPSRKRPSRTRREYDIKLDYDDEELFERSDTRTRYSNYYSPAYYSPVIISSLSDGLQPYHTTTVQTRPDISNLTGSIPTFNLPGDQSNMRGGKKVTKVKLTKLI
jgi:hypothetical protein